MWALLLLATPQDIQDGLMLYVLRKHEDTINIKATVKENVYIILIVPVINDNDAHKPLYIFHC